MVVNLARNICTYPVDLYIINELSVVVVSLVAYLCVLLNDIIILE